MKPDSVSAAPSPLTRAKDWWQEARKHLRQLNDLSRLNPTELERVAADVGLSTDELMQIARQSDGTALLIAKRLTILNMDPEDIRSLSPLLLRDLERTCALCAEKGRCAHDLAEDSMSAAWEQYCANSGTLRSLI